MNVMCPAIKLLTTWLHHEFRLSEVCRVCVSTYWRTISSEMQAKMLENQRYAGSTPVYLLVIHFDTQNQIYSTRCSIE